MASKILEKMSNENIISPFLALQENILVQKHDPLEQNKEINQKLPEITSRFYLSLKEIWKLVKRSNYFQKHAENFTRNVREGDK